MKGKFRKILGVGLALALVASLGMVFAAPASANPVELQVNIVTPIEDEQFNVCDDFWVNATIANPTGTKVTGVKADIDISANAIVVLGDDPQGPVDILAYEVADFWWQLHCTGAGTVDITVSAATGYEGSDMVTVSQVEPPPDPVLVVTITECPDGQTIDECTTFGVKADVENVSDQTVTGVSSSIDIGAGAHRVDCPGSYDLPDMLPGDVQEVGWTLHCYEPTGDVVITVDADFDGAISGEVIPDICVVHQKMPAAIDVVVEASVDKVCTECEDTFTVSATISEVNGDVGVTAITATISEDSAGAWVSITPPTTKPVPDLAPGGSETVSWDVECTGAGSVTFTVDVTGYDAETSVALPDSATGTVTQTELMVDIIAPDDESAFNKCQDFDFTYRVTNCLKTEVTDVTAGIILTACTELVGEEPYMVDVVPEFGEPFTAEATRTTPGPPEEWEITIGGMCGCCYADVTWHLHCSCSEMDNCTPVAEELEARARKKGGWLDSDWVDIYQMEKAHLVAGIESFPGTHSDSDFSTDPAGAFTVCEDFTVVASVANLGEAGAKYVSVTLDINGNVSPSGPLTQTIDYIGCHDAGKAMWEFHCDDEGDVTFTISALSGTDENTDAAIPADNIDIPCPMTVKQIPFDVVIIQPLTCTPFTVGDTFTVKAQVTNGSTLGEDLIGVLAELDWTADGNVALATGQENPVDLMTLVAGEMAEATWQMVCTGAGDVSFTVTATSTAPPFSVVSNTETVHQKEPADLEVEILSPAPEVVGPISPDSFAIVNHHSEFPQTGFLTVSVGKVKLTPIGCTIEPGLTELTAADGKVTLTFEGGGSLVVGALEADSRGVWEKNAEYPFGYHLFASITVDADGDATVWAGGELAGGTGTFSLPDAAVEAAEIPGFIATSQDFALTALITNNGGVPITIDTATVTAADTASVLSGPTPALNWTLDPGQSVTPTWTLHCDASGATNIALDVSGTDDLGIPHAASDVVAIQQYAAAHLEVQNISAVPSTINVSENFTVTADIVNTGEADAWEVSAILSVFPEGSARVVEGGYTQPVGTLVGHGQDDNAEVSWTLHCKVACESTITITAEGFDEFGYHLKQIEGELGLYSEPGRAIPDRFIESDSVTVKQLEPPADADLLLTKVVDPTEPVEVGSEVNFTVTVKNLGPADATSIMVYDMLSPGLNFTGVDLSQGWYYPGEGMWSVGDLAVGETATLTLTATVNRVGDIHNVAAIGYFDQHDPNTSNDTDYAVVTGLEPEPFTFWCQTLDEGYNLISLTLIPDVTNMNQMLVIDNGLAPIAASYWTGGPTGVGEWLDFWSWNLLASDLTTIEDGKGYWLDVDTANQRLCYAGSELVGEPPAVPPAYDVVEGWNLIGFKSTRPKPVEEYLAGIADKYVMVYGFADGAYFIAGSPGHEMLQPGLGYWLAVSDPAGGTIYP